METEKKRDFFWETDLEDLEDLYRRRRAFFNRQPSPNGRHVSADDFNSRDAELNSDRSNGRNSRSR